MAASKANATAGAQAPAAPAATRAAEFPARAGHHEAEVDKRSPDGSEGLTHVKEFVLLGRADNDISDTAHTANKAAAAQEAIQRGLHPHGDIVFEGATDLPDGRSVVLTYTVPVVASSIDHDTASTTTPRSTLNPPEGGED
jgi:hypothetical protein